MRGLAILLMCLPGLSMAHPAIESFTTYCFKAGQTPAMARANMEGLAGAPLPFTLTFWDTTLVPEPDAPAHVERRCKVSFAGDHTADAVAAVREKMATPPVFGTPIALPAPFASGPGSALIEARELLRQRVAVVHIGQHEARTFIQVDRLPAGMGVPE